MILKKLESIYKWVDKIGPRTKTLIIVLLFGALLYAYHIQYIESMMDEILDKELIRKEKAEEYVRDKAYDINYEVSNILEKDADASNVILLNYHNTLNSSHGLSYRYLTALTEKRRGVDTKACFKYWKELDYINFGNEIEIINLLKYLRVDSVNKIKATFPNFTDILEQCDCKAAAFYPIHGLKDYIGMIVVLYKNDKKYSLGYYLTNIHEPILNLAILLDYNSYLKNNKIN